MTTKGNGGVLGQDTAAQILGRPPNLTAEGSTQERVIASANTSTKVESSTLVAALDHIRRGIPVFVVEPNGKAPATRNGFKDATLDEDHIRREFLRVPNANLGVPTGLLSWDTLDVDIRPGGDGHVALEKLREAGLLDGAIATRRTPSGGLHVDFRGTNQGCGRLPRHFLDFKSTGGYVLVPPSTVDGRPYVWVESRTSGGRRLVWDHVRAVLEPARPSQPHRSPSNPPIGGITPLARWVSEQPEGNRNAGLYWASCRAIEGGHRGDLSLLVEAAVQAGLSEHEASRTVASAERRLAGAA